MSLFRQFFRKHDTKVVDESLPEHRVRVSARARYVRLRMSESEGLVVVIPKGFDRRDIADILRSRRDWIEKTRHKLESLPACKQESLPELLAITATGQEWQLLYLQGKSQTVSIRCKGENTLLLQGNIVNQAACRAALRRWLARHAREVLVPWLEGLSHEHGLPFQKTTVRTQKTRWASCSSRGTISINTQLLFLEKEQVDYVFLHELCHTVHMNHSPRFWALLGKMLPDYKKHHYEIQNNWKNIPGWARKNQ